MQLVTFFIERATIVRNPSATDLPRLAAIRR
jgi:hypothetical protein